MKQELRIGSGSAWWADRIGPARVSAERGDLDYLCFETMAEATVSMAQVRKLRDPSFGGYDTYLDDRMHAVLPGCLKRGTKIISNQGWIEPAAAARRVVEILQAEGVHGVRVASVTGTNLVAAADWLSQATIMETGLPLNSIDSRSIVSAEAYLGAEPIVAALRDGADIVITGRVADPSLFLAPMMYEFGWAADDWDHLGKGTGVGHLLECAAQVTGGYFADPGFKDVPSPWDLGFPIAEVGPDGDVVITKVPGTGGAVSRETVLEQMFYEVHDPAAYITPDVVVDFTAAAIELVGTDRVSVRGITGTPRTPTLKVSVGCLEGYVGEDMFFYAGPGALARAQLARTILEHRLAEVGLVADELRIDLLGVNAIHGAATPPAAAEPYEVAVRVAARAGSREEAGKVAREVDGMAVSGVGMTGKRVPHMDRVREVVGIWSALIDRDQVGCQIEIRES